MMSQKMADDDDDAADAIYTESGRASELSFNFGNLMAQGRREKIRAQGRATDENITSGPFLSRPDSCYLLYRECQRVSNLLNR